MRLVIEAYRTDSWKNTDFMDKLYLDALHKASSFSLNELELSLLSKGKVVAVFKKAD